MTRHIFVGALIGLIVWSWVTLSFAMAYRIEPWDSHTLQGAVVAWGGVMLPIFVCVGGTFGYLVWREKP